MRSPWSGGVVSAETRRVWCRAPRMRTVFLWAIVLGVGAVAACGSTGAGNSPPGQGCPAGQVYCSACGGGGFCASSTCPAFSCPAPADAGESEASMPASCPSGQTACTDCGRGTLCLSAGCGSIFCPSLDASTGESGGSPVDGPQPCHTNADCTSSFAFNCSPGGGTVGCGAVARPPFPCNVDSDCQLIDGAAPPKPVVCGQPGGCVSGGIWNRLRRFATTALALSVPVHRRTLRSKFVRQRSISSRPLHSAP